MADRSTIEWTDSTFNPWIGCTKVSPACDHCYAEVSTPSRTRSIKWGTGKPRQRTSAENWKRPLQWNVQWLYTCRCGYRGTMHEMTTNSVHACGLKFNRVRRRVFCASLADWLDNEVPAEWLADLLHLIHLTPNLDWLLLTKRIGNWEARLTVAHQHVVKTMGGGTAEYAAHPLWELGMWIQDWIAGKAPANIWIGASVCKQTEADRDIPKLLRVPAAVRFLSIEPMLGPIDLTDITRKFDGGSDHFSALYDPDDDCADTTPYVNWVIAGGESGTNARPMHPDWPRALRDQCDAAGAPFLFKQWGEWAPDDHYTHMPKRDADIHEWFDGDLVVERSWRYGKKAAGRVLDGVTHDGYPEPNHG